MRNSSIELTELFKYGNILGFPRLHSTTAYVCIRKTSHSPYVMLITIRIQYDSLLDSMDMNRYLVEASRQRRNKPPPDSSAIERFDATNSIPLLHYIVYVQSDIWITSLTKLFVSAGRKVRNSSIRIRSNRYRERGEGGMLVRKVGINQGNRGFSTSLLWKSTNAFEKCIN